MKPHRVFGIVLSAGGFEPLQTIISRLSCDTGAVFVILQHMSKDQANLLGSLVAKRTDLPVHSIEDQKELLANHIYVSPPGYTVELEKKCFKLREMAQNKTGLKVFDLFLNSLANEYQQDSVAVILSGAGEDGKKGATAIRQQGGLLLVQDPDTAEFRSMPEHTIDASAPDIVLRTEKLADLIEALAKQPEQNTDITKDGAIYHRIMAALYKYNSVDFSHYKISTIQRRIGRRMFLHKLQGKVSEYLGMVERDEDEAKALARDLLIGVSQFFRDPTMFELFAREYLPKQIDRLSGKELRIWVAGCATGEEAYTYVIICLAYIKKHKLNIDFKVLASDINNVSIEKASKGIYPASIAADVPKEYLEEYFTKSERHYRVKDDVREKVIFFKHDMVEDIPFTNIDIVSCRNVFIYFNLELQKLVARSFGFALNPGGLLLLSPSESLTAQNNFEQVDDHWRIYKLVTKPRYAYAPTIGWRKQLDSFFSGYRVPGQTAPEKTSNPRDRLLTLLTGRYVPLILVVNSQSEIVYVLGNTRGILYFPDGEPVNDLSRIADPSLRLPVSNGIRKLLSGVEEVEYKNIPIKFNDDSEQYIDLRLCMLPGGALQQDLIAVLFERISPSGVVNQQPDNVDSCNLDQLSQQRINDLEEELFFTRQSLRSAIEELEGSNEELQSANEEMQSGNEELQSTNEELQSTNEELKTLNCEYQAKVKELSQLNDDVHNLMETANLTTVIVDDQERVRLASPGAYQMIHFAEQDLGRPIGNFSHRISGLNLSNLIQESIKTKSKIEREGITDTGEHYLVRANPFVKSNKEITGVGVDFIDISQLRETEFNAKRLASVVTNSDDAIIIRDLGGKIVAWNDGAKQMYGWPEKEMLGKNISTVIPEEVRHQEFNKFKLFLANESFKSHESQRLTQSGETLYVWVTYTAIYDDDQQLIEIATIEHDITEQRRLQRETSLAAVAFETIDGIMVTDAQGTIVRVNQAFVKITGYEEHEAVGQNISILQSDRHPPEFYNDIWSSLFAEGRWAGEVWNKSKFGRIYPEWLTMSAVYDESGAVTHLVGVFRDISEQKENEAAIRKLAFYDSLTNLPNRRLFGDRLDRAIIHCHRSRSYAALAFLDLDRFKNINDSLGHGVGDALLVKVAERLQAAVRQEDTIARFGGDEFVILLMEVGNNEREAISLTEQVIRKIMVCIEEPYDIGDHKLHTSVSVGITLFCFHQETPDDLLRQADNAMYLAKKTGRRSACFFDPSLQAEADKYLELEKNLRDAVAHNHFELYYQPLVDFNSGCCSAEALLRWKKPDGTMVSPVDFIPVCEESGLMHTVGKWVLNQACLQIRTWSDSENIKLKRIAVNISPSQFMHNEFVNDVIAAMEAAGIEAHLLELEITENLLLEDTKTVADKMHQLKEIGVRFSIDDFGTGYSSLAYIKSLPVDKIKIDRTFVKDVQSDQDSANIVESIIAMALKMNLELIAEGVELKEQVDFLLKCGCSQFQGYLYSKPLTAIDFEQFYCQFDDASVN